MDRRLERLVCSGGAFCVVLVLALASVTVPFGARPGTSIPSASTSSIADPGTSLQAGGYGASGSDGNRWTQIPFPWPPARYAHAMAYDSRSDRVILFGGFEGGVSSNETWSYDDDTNAWAVGGGVGGGVVSLHCKFSHTNFDDPIVFPGQPGAAHQHGYVGSHTTSAASNLTTMQASATSCPVSGDTAGYWFPLLVNPGGTVLFPAQVNIYYRSPTGQTIQPFPSDLRIIVGGDTKNPPRPDLVQQSLSYSCFDSGPFFDHPIDCGDRATIAHVHFPNCVLNDATDSTDHRSHMVFAAGKTCPSGYSQVPKLSLHIRYLGVDDGAYLTSDTATSAPGQTLHADFWNTWQPAALDCLVSILNSGISAKGSTDANFTSLCPEGAANAPPTVSDINPYLSIAVLGQGVTLTAASSDPDEDVLVFTWTFGDGTTTTGTTAAGGGTITATHTYTAPGTYAVSLTVDDGYGGTATKSASVRVAAPLGLEISAQPPTGTVPFTVSFAASPSGGVPPYSFQWDFGDGSMSTTQNPTHIYQVAGTYTVTLTASDADGRTTTKTIQITANSPTVPSAPRALQASAGANAVNLSWQPGFSDGGSSITGFKIYRGTSPGGESLLATVGSIHSYTDAGLTNDVTYFYQLSAVNAVGEGQRSNEVSATTTAYLPLQVSASGNLTTGVAPLTVSFSASASGGISPYSFHWDFGDGDTSALQDPSHTYGIAGSYSVILTVTDAAGRTTTKTIPITASSPGIARSGGGIPVWVFYGLVAVAAGSIVGIALLHWRKVRRTPPPQT